MIVVDASAMLEALLQGPAAGQVRAFLFRSGLSLHAPHLLDVEVAQVLRRLSFAGEIDAEDGRAALTNLLEFAIQRHSHSALMPRVWSLRDNLTAYDAMYVALAESIDAPLLTRDRRLARAAGHLVKMELV